MRKQPKQTQSSKQNQGAIRIIAGKYRGRKLPVILADGLRPTTDRVKETVFNWLMPYIVESSCLDCFAGAGSLGFEASSRGAKQVALIELDKSAATQLNANKNLLKADNITIYQQDCLDFLGQHSVTKFDVVFIDPPFRKGLAQKTVNLLANNWLNTNALIYIEVEQESTALTLPTHWQLLKEKNAGQVAYRLYQAT